MTFTLDTSGSVLKTVSARPFGTAREWRWSDLTPFAQGYVEAMFADWAERLNEQRIALGLPLRRVAYRDLAPETLARIIADCEQALADKLCGYMNYSETGAMFWKERQADQLNGMEPRFPPLTVSLNDQGKVVFGEQA